MTEMSRLQRRLQDTVVYCNWDLAFLLPCPKVLVGWPHAKTTTVYSREHHGHILQRKTASLLKFSVDRRPLIVSADANVVNGMLLESDAQQVNLVVAKPFANKGQFYRAMGGMACSAGRTFNPVHVRYV